MAEGTTKPKYVPAAVEGTAPDGSPVRVDLSTGRCVLYFMTSSCRPCRVVWPRLGPGDVAVTPGPTTEQARDVAALAPDGATVVMSSEAWFAFRAGPAPWRVELRDGVVVSSGSGLLSPGSRQTGAQRVDGVDDV